MINIPEALALAVNAHQAGNLPRAEALYRQILQADPNQPDAWHLLGVIAQQVGQSAAAVECIGRAIQLNPVAAAYHNNLGEAYRGLERLDEALACYRRALALDPTQADATYNLNLQVGNILQAQGKLEEAADCYRRAIEAKPTLAAPHFNLGNTIRELGRILEAIDCYRRAVQLQPDLAEAHNNLGSVLLDEGQLAEAGACFQRALEIRPDYVEAHSNAGSLFLEQGKYDEAVSHCRRALELQPDMVAAYSNLGGALRELGNLDEAIVCCRRALELKPDMADAFGNLGSSLHDLGKNEEALAAYDRAIELKPDFAEVRCNRAMMWLSEGKFEAGLPEFEWRWKRKDARPIRFHQPRWNGSPLQGRSILLFAEQGLGDTLHFIRYAPLVKQLGGKVLVECQAALIPLLKSMPGVDVIVPQGSSLPEFDVQAPLLSLPGIFKTTLKTIPHEVPYMFADRDLRDHWQQRLKEMPGFKIGIVWQGDRGYKRDRFRSLPLDLFAPLAKLPGVQLISLQKGAGSEQVAAFAEKHPLLDLAPELDNASGPFMDTAAVLCNLDLVLAPDTATAHLAGALGVPVWLLLSAVPHWAWLVDRQNSPWYPTMRLFRQRILGEWDTVIETIREEIVSRISGQKSIRP
jgi:tetratricopeptide (TPR) repeat protein